MSDTKSPYKLDRWHKLNAEERSWILLRAYKGGLITQAQASGLTGAYTLSWVTTFGAPLALYPAFKFGLGSFVPGLSRTLGSKGFRVLNAGLTASAFFIWKINNPFNSAFLQEKETLLGALEEKVGAGMMQLNEMLPRHYTEYEVMRRIRLENQGGHLFGLLNFGGYGITDRDILPKVPTDKWPTPVTGKLTK